MELQCRNNETSHDCQGIPLKRSLKQQQYLTHVNSFLYKPQNGPSNNITPKQPNLKMEPKTRNTHETSTKSFSLGLPNQ